jgi:hypothetical protein
VHADKPVKTVRGSQRAGRSGARPHRHSVRCGPGHGGIGSRNGSAPHSLSRRLRQALHYRRESSSDPVRVSRWTRSDGQPLHPFEATFMGTPHPRL